MIPCWATGRTATQQIWDKKYKAFDALVAIRPSNKSNVLIKTLYVGAVCRVCLAMYARNVPLSRSAVFAIRISGVTLSSRCRAQRERRAVQLHIPINNIRISTSVLRAGVRSFLGRACFFVSCARAILCIQMYNK